MTIEQQTGFSAGVDVGGTFTDVVVARADGLWRAKTPTTHGEIGEGVIAALSLAAEQIGIGLNELVGGIVWFGLGTTAVTNVIAEVRGARVGLLTTAGFEDELNLARGIRFSVEGPVQRPVEIVPSRAIEGVAERIDRTGLVLQPLDLQAVLAAVGRLIERADIECLAISFVNAYRNPAHEDAAAAAIREAYPDLPVVAASALDAGFGFLQRTMFAALNAFASAAFVGVDELVARLGELGLSVPLRLVNATGGVTSVDGAREKPLTLMQSGPAAGVAAAASVGRRLGLSHVLACDMGGTSFDISVINDSTPLRRLNAEILRVPTGMSMVDVDSIGAGGGSVGWADSRGMLRVGPRSAGSIPGPACYGWGGREPTVTDALVVLGYIDPANFLGGRMALDAEAARTACADLGAKLGLSAIETAWGIRRIALADMTRVTRSILSRRGLDPQDYTIVSYGGCGSLFNADIAKALGVGRVVAPDVASVLSAFGAATAPVRRERTRAVAAVFPLAEDAVAQVMAQLGEAVTADLASDQVPADERTVTFEAAMRFKRQPSELAVPVRPGLTGAALSQALQDDFQADYVRRYGESSVVLGAPVELVSLRAIGSGQPHELTAARTTVPAARPVAPSSRLVHLHDHAEPEPVKVLLGRDLAPGLRIEGPACVDDVDTTIWIPPEAVATVDADMALIIDIARQSEAADAGQEAA